MITPQLEKMILCGQAFFKSFVAGGDKHTLTFGNDRYIIITDITYFPSFVPTAGGQSTTQQVAIYGERGYNHYLFRSMIDLGEAGRQTTGPITINTFILHEQQVGFSFCDAPFLSNTFNGVANTNNPGYKPPLDFGIDGQPGALPVLLTADAQNAPVVQNNFVTRPTAGTNESQQVFFPFNAPNQLLVGDQNNYQFLLVNYVEILGQPGNIQI